MRGLDPARIADATGGRWLRTPDDDRRRRVGIDSRVDLTGHAFLAIRGDRHDGHDHLDAAIDAGAEIVIGSDETRLAIAAGRIPTLLVDCGRAALASLARTRRAELRATVVAITGSAGKTSVKSMLGSILDDACRITIAPRSFNNEIGVPLTLLAAGDSDDVVVLEIGTNAPGEIAHLAAIARPDIAVITSIGSSHLAGLGDRAGVREEKGALLDALAPDGCAIVIDTQPELRERVPPGVECMCFGATDDADVRLSGSGVLDGVWWMTVGRDPHRWRLALPGRHQAINALAAIAVSKRLGIDHAHRRRGLAEVRVPGMRFDISFRNELHVVNDAYNANPESTRAGLATFIDLSPPHPRTVVIGDMLELGSTSAALHDELVGEIAELERRGSIDRVMLVGETLAATRSAPPHWYLASSIAAIPDEIVDELAGGSGSLFLKGSRGVALEGLLTRIDARHAKTAEI